MNFLKIVQALHRESTDSGTGPETVVSQTGEYARKVAWCADGYTQLQQEMDNWLWLRKSFYVDTVAGDGAYAYTDCTDTVTAMAIARFARWYQGRYDWKCYLSSTGVSGEYFLQWLEWEDFRYLYRRGTQTDGQPVHVSSDPTMAFVLGPKPNAVYRVNGDYQKGPQVLALDADEPEMPSRFHALVWLEGLSRYGGNRVAPEAMLRAVEEGGRLRAALELNQLPRFRMGPPLA